MGLGMRFEASFWSPHILEDSDLIDSQKYRLQIKEIFTPSTTLTLNHRTKNISTIRKPKDQYETFERARIKAGLKCAYACGTLMASKVSGSNAEGVYKAGLYSRVRCGVSRAPALVQE